MNITPFSPKRVSSTSMIMQLEAVVVCGATLMIWNSGRRTLPVISLAPETKPSAWCMATIMAPK